MCARGVPWSEFTVDRYRACALKWCPVSNCHVTNTSSGSLQGTSTEPAPGMILQWTWLVEMPCNGPLSNLSER